MHPLAAGKVLALTYTAAHTYRGAVVYHVHGVHCGPGKFPASSTSKPLGGFGIAMGALASPESLSGRAKGYSSVRASR